MFSGCAVLRRMNGEGAEEGRGAWSIWSSDWVVLCVGVEGMWKPECSVDLFCFFSLWGCLHEVALMKGFLPPSGTLHEFPSSGRFAVLGFIRFFGSPSSFRVVVEAHHMPYSLSQ